MIPELLGAGRNGTWQVNKQKTSRLASGDLAQLSSEEEARKLSWMREFVENASHEGSCDANSDLSNGSMRIQSFPSGQADEGAGATDGQAGHGAANLREVDSRVLQVVNHAKVSFQPEAAFPAFATLHLQLRCSIR